MQEQPGVAGRKVGQEASGERAEMSLGSGFEVLVVMFLSCQLANFALWKSESGMNGSLYSS